MTYTKFRARFARILLLFLLVFAPIRALAVGWTPTDGGLVLNLEQGDRFLLSVWVDKDGDGVEDEGEEFFVYNYNRYKGGYFNYTEGLYLKLLPQAADATEPSDMSIWQVGAPLDRGNYALGGIVYTIWNDGKTLKTGNNTNYQFLGDLTTDYNDANACDAVFVLPTDRRGIVSFDPNRTMGRGETTTTPDADGVNPKGRFNGATGTGFLGMTYREVYWLEIPRGNQPRAYTNAALVTFNRTLSQKSWSNGQIKCNPGHAAYAYADDKHKPTTRTVFRIYMLDDPINSCGSYYFATDVQNKNKKYRKSETMNDSTPARKIYTWDHLYCMEHVGDASSKIYKSGYMNVPAGATSKDDSTFYYVGKNDTYVNEFNKRAGYLDPTGTAVSQFKYIDSLRIFALKDSLQPNGKPFIAPAGAYGRMVVDTTSTKQNLAVAFEPKGYFFQTNSGTNVNMRQVDDSTWMVDQMWYIAPTYMALQARIMLYTGAEFNASDAGAAIAGWSVYVDATDIPVVGGGTASGKYGWARIHTNRAAQNGGMEFVVADQTRHVHYDNNGHFGAAVPDQYPEVGKTKVAAQAPRLIKGYVFDNWNTEANGTGTAYEEGDSIPLPSSGVLTLYAQARYTGSIHVAISFMKDGQRYFLTHPGVAPRYASIRHFEDWVNVWQGMADINNSDPNYISTYKIIGKETVCAECEPDEYVLDPHSETMNGAVDSLVFYENFHPENEEYIGLYYTSPSYIVANNTWAGLFTSSNGWPTPARACVSSTQLASDSYLERNGEGVITRYTRTVTPKDASTALLPANIQYNSESSVFDGVTEAGTDFMISGVGVVDEHYIILPDTSTVWRDTIEFGFHEGVQTREDVWSKLIGKQLLAQMKVGDDTIYFHPNRDKIINDPNELYLSQDFRVTQLFSFIQDTRVTSIHAEDLVSMEATSNYWHYNIISGLSSPIDIKDARGNYVDVVDTFRIELSHGNISKVKKYYGRWADDAPGMHFSGTSRVRDIIVRTKTYHYEPEQSHLVLTPEYDSYTFYPLMDHERILNFTLKKVTTQRLVDVEGNFVRLDTVSIEDVTSDLHFGPSDLSFAATDSFAVVNAGTVDDHITLKSKYENKSNDVLDTLVITKNITIDGIVYPVSARVPLVQTSLEGDELIWSVVHNGQRYFITTDGTNVIFRQYRLYNSILYKYATSTHLIKGSKDATNSDIQYITPWRFRYNPSNASQLSLKTEYGIGRYLKMSSEEKGAVAGVNASDSSLLTYVYVDVRVNANSNEEEIVKLKYGSKMWLKFTYSGSPQLELTDSEDDASEFSWAYLNEEFNLTNNGTYPNPKEATFGYNNAGAITIQTRYKAYTQYSMLLDNKLTYLCRKDEVDIADLVNASDIWKTDTAFALIPDARDFDGTPDPVSGLEISARRPSELKTTIKPKAGSTTSPTNVTIGGKYVNIVDTLNFRLSLKTGAPHYRYAGEWSWMQSVSDAELKIPLIRKTYHTVPYDSLICKVKNDEQIYTFPNQVGEDSVAHTFTLSTQQRRGTNVMDVDNNVVAILSPTNADITVSGGMDLSSVALAEIRLVDEFGNTPDWCTITGKTATTLTVRCWKDGIRSPRSAYLYLAYVIMEDHDGDPATEKVMGFVNYRITLTQPSYFDYANNQHLEHSPGASGDPVDPITGMQQVHENKRILYYYPDQDVELPIRERHFFGWWRWYREGNDVNGDDVSDTDIPDSLWRTKPTNTGKYNYPFRTIGDSVKVLNPKKGEGGEPDSIKQLVTMGRYTVFHYKSKDYGNKADPPAKTPTVAPPITRFGVLDSQKPTLTYAVDLSNYYDNLPLSLKQKNQVDTAMLDTMRALPEPTLSLREVFELHPWTEMADTLDHYKSERTDNDAGTYELKDEKYMEDHTVMAPIGNRLLLKTEQRYNAENVLNSGHSESLLGYYMRDDNWASFTPNQLRQDTMIWCGGWDTDCKWYTYDPGTKKYTPCTHSITESDDFLDVPKKEAITGGYEFDTVYYCLRARSWKSTFEGDVATSVPGDNMFNICRYMVVYHDTTMYGPLKERKKKGVDKALITNQEIEQRYEILQTLNFDYIQPGSDYHVYPHPLPWSDASYGYTYPETSDLPHNRFHDESDFPNMGEYGLINKIKYSTWWNTMEQHGGADKGYMIYCDGMSSAGQVAALTLDTTLCPGQKMFFSAYVGNPSNQKGKANPNFVFSVQGRKDEKSAWKDITSYMTGDIPPSDHWYQIFFPIIHVTAGMDTAQYRVRIYNMASNWDGNDFIIDDMCIFATKPPLIAYQATTACKAHDDDESSDTHVILRLDYQGITGEGYNDKDVFYTIRCVTPTDSVYFLHMDQGYLRPDTAFGKPEGEKADTLYGQVFIPALTYEPQDEDSIYVNMTDLIARYDSTADSGTPVQEGYIYEVLEGTIRPVKYIIHSAKMPVENDYTVHMSYDYSGLMSSICGMTSRLKVTDRMVLAIDGEEQPTMEVIGMCANATYELGLHVKGSMYVDSVAPIELTGTCYNDWLLYGDTADATSKARYGYKYSDIEKVIKNVLRYEPMGTKNRNQFASNFSAIKRKELDRMQAMSNPDLTEGVVPYELLKHLVEKGFLILYKSTMTVTVHANDSVEYVIFPISGTGTDALHSAHVDVCTVPLYVKLAPRAETAAPLILGGIPRKPTDYDQPITLLMEEAKANGAEFAIKIDSILLGANAVAIDSIYLRSCNDSLFRPGVHTLRFLPDKEYNYNGSNPDYYDHRYSGRDSIYLRPASDKNYHMRGGYRYTFVITLRSKAGLDTIPGGCPIGKVPFTIAVVPAYLRWDPQNTTDKRWNNPDNWIGITQQNVPIHEEARFAPLSSTYVVIPPLADSLQYPELPTLPVSPDDSIREIGFMYNKCSYIRFMAGAAMNQQQRMQYDQAIVDMSLPHDKWAFRTSPVAGLISGDLFMSQADINWETSPWEVGEFDARGRSYKTGTGSFWLSLFNQTTRRQEYGSMDSVKIRPAEEDSWSQVTNALTHQLPAGLGWAVYTRTPKNNDATVRLPKNDDIYYYYNQYGDKMYDLYESDLQAVRASVAGSVSAGKLLFNPTKSTDQTYTITNTNASKTFIFGNPTMGYIDIWGFIADNTDLKEEIKMINESDASFGPVSKETALDESNLLSNTHRYLPPMRAIALTLKDAVSASTSLTVKLDSTRIVTDTVADAPAASPIRRSGAPVLSKGIMRITAKNDVDERCTTHLLLGQGYNKEIREGEDALLTTINIEKYTVTGAPATPFNIYALEGDYGLSINLLDSIVNVPVSFYMTENLISAFDPITNLWFTGVNNISVPLVLYDALTDTEQPIMDGICIRIETPQINNLARYYIRRRGYRPTSSDDPATGVGVIGADEEKAFKFMQNGQVYILRSGHVYTVLGQKIK